MSNESEARPAAPVRRAGGATRISRPATSGVIELKPEKLSAARDRADTRTNDRLQTRRRVTDYSISEGLNAVDSLAGRVLDESPAHRFDFG